MTLPIIFSPSKSPLGGLHTPAGVAKSPRHLITNAQEATLTTHVHSLLTTRFLVSFWSPARPFPVEVGE